MSWTTPTVRTTGELITAADWNGDLVDNLNYLHDRVAAPRVATTTSSATPTPDCDNDDVYSLTALATNPTFAAPAGTPVNCQKLIIRIKDNGTPRTLAWNAIYVDGGTPLPTVTTAGKTTHVGFIYNTDNALNKWMCVGVQTSA